MTDSYRNRQLTNLSIFNNLISIYLIFNYCSTLNRNEQSSALVEIATTAKRLRQFFEEIIPEDISAMVQNLHHYRKKLKGDFEYKVDRMNQLTEPLVEREDLKF